MAKIAATKINVAINAVAIEDELSSSELSVTQESIKVDGLSSVGPERVVGNYDFGLSLEGSADFATGQGDATLFALVGNAGVAMAFDPTGGAAGVNDPNYDSTKVVLASYSIKGGVGQAVTYSASLEGAAALTRAVA